MSEPNSKVVLITGCSSGFGLVTAAYLAQKNFQVIATMRNLDRSQGLINEASKRGITVDPQRLDVTDIDSIKDVMAYVADKYGHLDVLINNAGYGMGGAFEDLSDREIREQMETNFFGVQNVTREAIPLMRHRGDARIINIGSVAGRSSSPMFGAYNASKWALEGFSESLYYELKQFGIKVCLIEPGVYKTNIFFDNRKVAENFNNPSSPYYDMSQHLRNRVDAFVADNHKDVEEIAHLIEKLINSKHPRFRTQPDLEAKLQMFLKRLLPFSLYSKMVESTVFKGFEKNKTSS